MKKQSVEGCYYILVELQTLPLSAERLTHFCYVRLHIHTLGWNGALDAVEAAGACCGYW
jgi:hypothetical protein